MKNENGSSSVPVKGIWLRRISRISAWALLAGVAVLVLSGWGITQTGVITTMTFGLIDRRLANTIHGAATVPLVLFFLLHVVTNFSLKLSKSRPVKKWVINGLLYALGIFILGTAIYLQYFRLGG